MTDRDDGNEDLRVLVGFAPLMTPEFIVIATTALAGPVTRDIGGLPRVLAPQRRFLVVGHFATPPLPLHAVLAAFLPSAACAAARRAMGMRKGEHET
jgi:hypothetical protein